MKEHLKISVITPSFNQGAFIGETLASVLDQRYPNLEFLVLDGGSTDNSVAVIKKYESQLTIWVSKKDGGQANAINEGLKKATGDIVCWLNSDDLFLQGTLAKVNSYFLNNPDVSLVYGNGIDFSKDASSVCMSTEFNNSSFISGTKIPQPSVFWRRKLHEKVGYLDGSLHYMMDFDLWLRIFYTSKTLRVDDVFSKLRSHPDAKTSGNPAEMYLEFRRVVSRFLVSIGGPSIEERLTRLGIMDAVDEYKISFTPDVRLLETMMQVYIHECAVQEYSWKNIRRANRLFCSSMSQPSLIKNLLFLIKNNLGYQFLGS